MSLTIKFPIHQSMGELPVGHELFGRNDITDVVKKYLPSGEQLLLDEHNQSLISLAQRVDLIDPKTLKTYLGPEWQNSAECLQSARKIVQQSTSLSSRPIAGHSGQHGFAFGMHPEILAYTMERARGKKVLEIGGASGENAVLIALGGASHVYMNDITSEEMDRFYELKRTLPAKIKDRLTGLEGNCFDLLTIDPLLCGQIDLVLCRNLIHLFPDPQLRDFFSLLKKTLKPGGQAILTANSAYASSTPQTFVSHADRTVFRVVQGLLEPTSGKIEKLFSFIVPMTEPADSFEKLKTCVYTKIAGQKLVGHKDAYSLFPSEVKEKVKEGLANEKKKILALSSGHVHILETCTRIFMKQNLAACGKEHGFHVDFTFVTSRQKGHLVPLGEEWAHGYQVGVILRAPKHPDDKK